MRKAEGGLSQWSCWEHFPEKYAGKEARRSPENEKSRLPD
jgi:hypothetical protein